MADREKIRWAPRIGQAKIWQLYQQDAQGIVDEELIDQLLHTFHHEIKAGRMPKAAACNLIEGKAPKVVAFLERLTYGDGSTPGIRETKEMWRKRLEDRRADKG